MAEVQEGQQTRLIAQGLFKLLLTPHSPLSHWLEQVTWPSPESEKEEVAEDMAKGVGVGQGKDSGQRTALGKLWPLLGASLPAFLTGSYLLRRCLRAVGKMSSVKH